MSDQVYEVEHIISKRHNRGRLEYFIKWKGYSKRHNSWVSSENLDCPDILTAFENSQKNNDELVQNEKKIEAQPKQKNSVVFSINSSKKISSDPTKNSSAVDEISEISSNSKTNISRSNKSNELKNTTADRFMDFSKKKTTKETSLKESSQRNETDAKGTIKTVHSNISIKRKRSKASKNNFECNKTPSGSKSFPISENDTSNNDNSSDSDSSECQFDYSDQKSDSEYECEPEFENPRKKKKQHPKNDSSETLKQYSKTQQRSCKSLKRLDSVSNEEKVDAQPKGMVKNLIQKDVYKQFADGRIDAKWLPDKSSDKYKLFKQIRRLTTNSESGKKFVQNYFYCTKCGRIIYINTQSHYNQLNRHYDNECNPQVIDQDKIVLCRTNFINLIESVMELGMEYGTTDVGNVPIPKQWTEKNRKIFLQNVLKETKIKNSTCATKSSDEE